MTGELSVCGYAGVHTYENSNQRSDDGDAASQRRQVGTFSACKSTKANTATHSIQP
jgi:hypothetical protein